MKIFHLFFNKIKNLRIFLVQATYNINMSRIMKAYGN